MNVFLFLLFIWSNAWYFSKIIELKTKGENDWTQFGPRRVVMSGTSHRRYCSAPARRLPRRIPPVQRRCGALPLKTDLAIPDREMVAVSPGLTIWPRRGCTSVVTPSWFHMDSAEVEAGKPCRAIFGVVKTRCVSFYFPFLLFYLAEKYVSSKLWF